MKGANRKTGVRQRDISQMKKNEKPDEKWMKIELEKKEILPYETGTFCKGG